MLGLLCASHKHTVIFHFPSLFVSTKCSLWFLCGCNANRDSKIERERKKINVAKWFASLPIENRLKCSLSGFELNILNIFNLKNNRFKGSAIYNNQHTWFSLKRYRCKWTLCFLFYSLLCFCRLIQVLSTYVWIPLKDVSISSGTKPLGQLSMAANVGQQRNPPVSNTHTHSHIETQSKLCLSIFTDVYLSSQRPLYDTWIVVWFLLMSFIIVHTHTDRHA